MLYQVLAVTILFAAFAWMGNNVVINLKALGKDFSFEFLGQASNYDINQRPIEYDSQSTHGRAMLIGIINTALVAFVGIIFASIIGLLVAIARLSPNWLLSSACLLLHRVCPQCACAVAYPAGLWRGDNGSAKPTRRRSPLHPV